LHHRPRWREATGTFFGLAQISSASAGSLGLRGSAVILATTG
jgi:hypothetical protein